MPDVLPYHTPGLTVTDFSDVTFGKATLRMPVVTPSVLSAAIDRVTGARSAGLAHMPISRIVDAIDRAVGLWLAPESRLMKEAVRQLPAITGFSTAMVRTGLPQLLIPFRKEGLHTYLQSEFGSGEEPRDLQEKTSLSRKKRSLGIDGPSMTSHILAGNIPAIGPESIIRALLLRSASIVKPSSGDPLTPALFAQSLTEADEEVGACVAVLWWPGQDLALTGQAVTSSDAVVAYGGDDAIRSVRGLAPSTIRFVEHGQRMSFAAIGREALTAAGVPALAGASAWDISFFDQQGCVSPQVIFVERDGQVSPLEFARALAEALRALETQLPRGDISVAEVLAIQRLRGVWEMRAASGEPTAVFQSERSTAWTVLYEEHALLAPTCLNRTIRVVAVDSVEAILPLVAPFRLSIQVVGVAMDRRRRRDVEAALLQAGVSWVCPIGEMQHPPAEWLQDGRHTLRELVQYADSTEANPI